MKGSLLLPLLCTSLVLSVSPVQGWQTPQLSRPQAVRSPAAGTHNWRRYHYDADGFTVEFPAEPQTKANGRRTGTRYIVALDNNKLAYLVEASALPSDSKKNSQQVLDDYLHGTVKGTKGQVKDSHAVTLRGNPGREFMLENDTMIFRGRVYLVQKTLYQVVVASTKDLAGVAEAERFQNSFDLLK